MRLSSITVGIALSVGACCLFPKLAIAAAGTTTTPSTIPSLQQQINTLQNEITKEHQLVSKFEARYHRGGYLYAGLNSAHPLDELPDTSFASAFLEEKQDFTRPLTVSGYLEFDAQAWGGNYSTPVPSSTNTYENGSGLFLTTAKLFTLFMPDHWVSFITDMEGKGVNTSISIENAALIIGNLTQTPFYFAVGRFHLAFGVFAGGGPWSSSIANESFKVGETTQAEVGFDKDGLNIALSGFNNGTFANNVDDFSVAAEYDYVFSQLVSLSVGAGYLNDIRGTDSGIGAAYASSPAVLNGKKNAVYDANATIGIGKMSFFGEYDRSQRGANVTVNGSNVGNSGPMSAWVVAAAYSHLFYGKPTSFSLSYSHTHNLANVPLFLSGDANNAVPAPDGMRNDIIASMSYEAIKNIYLGPEWQYATLYNHAGHTWTATLDVSAYF